jgi:diguanylate cyclase (GGDEF)-like protein
MNASILIVDDDPGAIQVLARMLEDLGDVCMATDGQEALRLMVSQRPDLVLLDADMPGLDGFAVCQTLKADPDLADIPVVFVTANRSAEFEVSGFDAGAADYITKPVTAPLVRARVRTQLRIKRLSDELRRIATEDPLTGVANRRRFDTLIRRELAIAQRSGQPLALMMVDIDQFKAYNDHYGHPAGDGCLRAVAVAVASACQRPADLVARIGGEEFAVLLAQTSLAAAATVAGRILDAVAALDLPHRGVGAQARVSVSVGVGVVTLAGAALLAHPPDLAGTMDALLASADAALYEAKRSGRNRACALHAAGEGRHGVLLPGTDRAAWSTGTT